MAKDAFPYYEKELQVIAATCFLESSFFAVEPSRSTPPHYALDRQKF
jgi:hypothetical protein